MITTGLFLVLVGIGLYARRKKVGWGSFAVGLFVAVLLMSTPLGGPMHSAVDAIAAGLRSVGNGVLTSLEGAVK